MQTQQANQCGAAVGPLRRPVADPADLVAGMVNHTTVSEAHVADVFGVALVVVGVIHPEGVEVVEQGHGTTQ